MSLSWAVSGTGMGGRLRRSRLAAGMALFAAIVLLLLGLHRDAFLGCYGFLDDYPLIDPARGFPDRRFLTWMLAEGRPLYGLLLNAVLLPIGAVCDLVAIRLVNIALVAAIALQCHALAIRGGWPRPAAIAMALLVLSTPGFAVAIAWATLIGPLVAIMASLAAARLATPPDEGPVPAHRLAGAIALVGAALAFYQPGAMAFVPGCAIALARRPMTPETVGRHVVPAGLALAAALGLYGVLFLTVSTQVDSELVSTRAQLTDDPWGKLAWFLGTALRQSLNLFNIEPVPRFGIAVAVLIAIGAWLRQRTVGRTALALLVQALAIVLAFLPNLTVDESWPAFRSSLPMTMTIAVLTAAALAAIAERLPAGARSATAAIVIGVPAIYGIAVTAMAAEAGIARLQKAEWHALVQGLKAIGAGDARPIVLVPAPVAPPPPCTRWQRFDELGLPSSARPFAAEGMRRRAWTEVHGAAPPDRFSIAAAPLAAGDDRIAIDLGAALAARAVEICGR